MTRWELGLAGKDQLTRQERLAVPDSDVPPRVPAHKNTKRWCKGKKGREHVLEIVVPENAYFTRCYWVTESNWQIQWSRTKQPWYNCAHVERCAACGKVLRRSHGWMADPEMKPEECPLYHPLS